MISDLITIADDAVDAVAEIERTGTPGDVIREMNDELVEMRAKLADLERRNVELKKGHDAYQLLALIRLSDLRDNNGEFEKLYDLLRNCYPIVLARCEVTDFGDASARATLEMIDEAFKRIELNPRKLGEIE